MIRLNDLGLLVPAFRERVELVLADLRAAGYAYRVHETARSRERALMLVAKGKSLAKGGLSMHCFGCAMDVICAKHTYFCRDNGCDFFERYGVAAEKHGLIWGGRWMSLNDAPHVQAVPIRLQDRIRTMPADEIDAFVRKHLEARS
jgi:D-alanyl-D-alanine carboxypeptidase-like protein